VLHGNSPAGARTGGGAMNAKNTKDSHEVIEFMGAFAKLKDWCDNEPDCLTGLAKEDEGVQEAL
jgi:hypothetical protein